MESVLNREVNSRGCLEKLVAKNHNKRVLKELYRNLGMTVVESLVTVVVLNMKENLVVALVVDKGVNSQGCLEI